MCWQQFCSYIRGLCAWLLVWWFGEISLRDEVSGGIRSLEHISTEGISAFSPEWISALEGCCCEVGWLFPHSFVCPVLFLCVHDCLLCFSHLLLCFYSCDAGMEGPHWTLLQGCLGFPDTRVVRHTHLSVCVWVLCMCALMFTLGCVCMWACRGQRLIVSFLIALLFCFIETRVSH